MKKDKLTAKEQRFVRSYAQGKPAVTALVEAGYNPTTKESAYNMASRITTRPRVQVALAKALEDEFPDAEKTAITALRDLISNTDTPGNTRIRAIETLAKIFGWNAPTKSASLNVTKKLHLPED